MNKFRPLKQIRNLMLPIITIKLIIIEKHIMIYLLLIHTNNKLFTTLKITKMETVLQVYKLLEII